MPTTPDPTPHPCDPTSHVPTTPASAPGGGLPRLLVPLPTEVTATYVVAALERPVADPAGEIAAALGGVPFPPGREPLTVTATEATRDDPALAWAREVLCCPDCSPGSERILGTLLHEAEQHLVITATAAPGWPPSHLYAAARAVDVLAEATGGLRLDAKAPRLLPSPWRPHLAAVPEDFAVADWLWIAIGPDPGGYALLTTGLSRLGLPELRAEAIASEHVPAWTRLFKGLAQALARRLFTHLSGPPPDSAVLALPAEFEVTTADVAAAEGAPGPAALRSATVRLARNPPGVRVPVSHLTVRRGEGDPADRFGGAGKSPPGG